MAPTSSNPREVSLVHVLSGSESASPTNLKFGLLSVAFIVFVARFGVVCRALISLRENLSKNSAPVPKKIVVPTGTNQVEHDATET
jgi:hypothetical protein